MVFPNSVFLVVRTFLLLLALLHESASQYEWTCSPYDSVNDRYYLPNFGGQTSVRGYTWAPSTAGNSYIYPITDLNCTGIVTDVEFCYNSRVKLVNNPESVQIFTLVVLMNSTSGNYVVEGSVDVHSTPSTTLCSGTGNTRQCCDRMNLTQAQFQPPQNFALGISVPSQGPLLQSLSDMMYSARSYVITGSLPTRGSMPNLGSITFESLRTVWFHIKPIQDSTTPPIPQLSSTPPVSQLSTPVPQLSTLVPQLSSTPLVSQLSTPVPQLSTLVPQLSSTPPVSQLSTSVPQLSTPVPQLSTSVPQLSTPVSQLSTPVLQLSTSVPQLSTPVSQMSTPVSQMSTPVPQLSTSVPQLGTSVPQLSTPVSQLSTPVSQLSTLVSQLNTPVSQLSTPVSQLSTPVSQLSMPVSQLSTPVPQLSTLVPQLSTPVHQLSSTPPVSQLSTPVPQLSISTSPVSQLSTPVPQLSTPVPQLSTPVPQLSTPVPQLSTLVPQLSTPVPQLSSIPPVSQFSRTPQIAQSSIISTLQVSITSSASPLSNTPSATILQQTVTLPQSHVNIIQTTSTDFRGTSFVTSITSLMPQESTSLLPESYTISTIFTRIISSMVVQEIWTQQTLATSTSTLPTHQSTVSIIANSSQATIIGGVVGGIMFLIFALILGILVIFFFVKIKQRRREWQIVERKNTGNTFTNAIYMSDSFGSNTIDGGTGAVNPGYEYVETEPNTKNENPYEFPVMDNTSWYNKVTGAYEKAEDIYVAPPKDVTKLYAQLEYFRASRLSREAIKLSGVLGSGQFGDVHEGIWNISNETLKVAVKTLKENASEEDRIKFLQEAAIMGQFRYPNVVKTFGVISEGEPVMLVLEMLKKGDLRKHLLSMRIDYGNEIKPELKEQDLLSYCRQVAMGMKYLSSKTFVHRDLAARNILVSDDNICKIADFGMSRDLMDETYYVSRGGIIPVKWTAPEALHYKKYSTASDVWSYGVVMYEIWSVGHKPFEGISNNEVLRKLDSGYRLPPPPGCPRAIYSIMISCWAPTSGQRPSFSEVCSLLSSPDSELLHQTKENEAAQPKVNKLGSELSCCEEMYKDLQVKYVGQPSMSVPLNTDYEDIS